MSLAENLKRIRAEKRISQVKLAKLSGISQQSLSRLENGTDLTSKFLPKIAAALHVPISDLDPSYSSSMPNSEWTGMLKLAISSAAEAGATLHQLRDVLEEAFHSYLAGELRSRIDELPAGRAHSAQEAAGKIAGKEGSSDKSGSAGT